MYKLFIYFQDLFVSSILPFLIELETTVRVFFQNHKLIATGLIMGTISIGIVLLGKPFIGICAVIGGFFLLFMYVLVLHLRVRVRGTGDNGT